MDPPILSQYGSPGIEAMIWLAVFPCIKDNNDILWTIVYHNVSFEKKNYWFRLSLVLMVDLKSKHIERCTCALRSYIGFACFCLLIVFLGFITNS